MENRAVAREETRRSLLRAATELIVEQGSTDQKMAAVAKRAEVSVRTVYTHFASFSELLAAAMTAITAEFSQMAPEHVDTETLSPRLALSVLVDQWFEQLSRSDARLGALISIRDSPELDAALAEARELRLRRVRAVLELAEKRAELQVPIETAVAIAYTATGYHSWVSLVHELGLSSDEAARLVARTIVDSAFRQPEPGDRHLKGDAFAPEQTEPMGTSVIDLVKAPETPSS